MGFWYYLAAICVGYFAGTNFPQYLRGAPVLTKYNAESYAILAQVISSLTEGEFRNLWVEPYLNGRENGFSVQFFSCSIFGYPDVKVTFSRNRNSDSLVVYAGNSAGFSMQGNGLTEEIYNNRRLFRHDQAYLAAAKVVSLLRGEEAI
jgi:hypothetical protein